MNYSEQQNYVHFKHLLIYTVQSEFWFCFFFLYPSVTMVTLITFNIGVVTRSFLVFEWFNKD